MSKVEINMVSDFGSDEANELAKELAKVRDTILHQFPSDGSSKFYEEWLIKTVESPYEINNMVKAYIEKQRSVMFELIKRAECQTR